MSDKINLCPTCGMTLREGVTLPTPPVAPAPLEPLDIVDDREDYEWNGEFTQESLDKGVAADTARRKGALAPSPVATADAIHDGLEWLLKWHGPHASPCTVCDKCRELIALLTPQVRVAPVAMGETGQRLAQWLHLKMSAAQNLPYEEGDTCSECEEAVQTELLPLLAAQLAGTPEQLDLTPFEKWWKDHFGSPHLDSTQQFNLEVMRSATEDAFILGLDNAADYAAPSQIGTPEQVREARLRGALYEHTEHCDYCIQNEPKWCSRGRELEAALATPPPREREPETSPKEDTK